MRRICSSRRAASSTGILPITSRASRSTSSSGSPRSTRCSCSRLSRIALSVLLALGPLFIALLFFETTKRFFEAWIAQLANYAFITILTVLVAALMLRVVTVAAQQAVSAGGGIQIADAVRVCMAAGLTFLVMRQVMPMAAGLASGLALCTFGVVSAALAWGFGGAVAAAASSGAAPRSGPTIAGIRLTRKPGYRAAPGAGPRDAGAPTRQPDS